MKRIHFANIKPANVLKQYKKMGKNSEKNELLTMRDFLAERKQITVLAERCKCSLSTVYDTFAQQSVDNLVGKQLTVLRNAIELINEIKSLSAKAAEAIKK